MAKRLQRIAVLSVMAVLAVLAGALLSAGRAAAEGQEPSGFVIHVDKVVGTLDLGGIVLKIPVVFTGDMPIAFIQAKIYGMTLTQQQTIAGHTVSYTFHTDQAAQTKWMKMRVKKMKIGGLCTDGVPVVEQCLKDVTVVATEMTAEELTIPQLSAEASFGAAPANGGGSAETTAGQQTAAPSKTDQQAVNGPNETSTPPGANPSASAPDGSSGGTPDNQPGKTSPASAPDDSSGGAPPASAPNDSSTIPPASETGGGSVDGSSPSEEELPSTSGQEPRTNPPPSSGSTEPPRPPDGTNPVGGLIENIKEKQKETGELLRDIKEAVQNGLDGEALEKVKDAVNEERKQLAEELNELNAALRQTKAQLENAQQELADRTEAVKERMGPLPLLDANEVKEAIEQTTESIRQHEAQLEQLEKLKQQLEKQAKELNGWLRALP
ncbi:hypothetical protein [Geobacillus stearothermophilus]|uniref:hypothetical protein n=1 Tax=Geobacillus stearothermophilus TaxID=1422 RepID=UPI0024027B7D|nr:hypothetical protein [Geobacillus stearothermophilus]MDF9296172.1 hypothetical protein [Geobacillus stearothermophilus]